MLGWKIVSSGLSTLFRSGINQYIPCNARLFLVRRRRLGQILKCRGRDTYIHYHLQSVVSLEIKLSHDRLQLRDGHLVTASLACLGRRGQLLYTLEKQCCPNVGPFQRAALRRSNSDDLLNFTLTTMQGRDQGGCANRSFTATFWCASAVPSTCTLGLDGLRL